MNLHGPRIRRSHAGYGSVNIVIDEFLWNLGGNLNNGLKSVAIFAHCSIQINDSFILVTGGKKPQSSDKTYFHNFQTGQWSLAPKMNRARFLHGCAKFTIKNEMILVVAGGVDSNAIFNEVEFLNMDNIGEGWVAVTKPLPQGVDEFLMVTSLDGKSVFAIGGNNGQETGDIQESHNLREDFPNDLDLFPTCRLQASLTFHHNVALLIPDSLVIELCKNLT